MEDPQDSNILRFPRSRNPKQIAHGKELIRCKWLHLLFLRIQREHADALYEDMFPDQPGPPSDLPAP